MEELAEGHEEEIWEEGEEVLVGQVFQPPPLPGWLSKSSWRLRWGFLWMPISSGVLGDGVSKSKTS